MKRFVSIFVSVLLTMGFVVSPASANVSPKLLSYKGHGPADGDFSAWTKLLAGGTQMKFYVKYPRLGQKIQFFAQQGGADYRQVAWKRVTQADLDTTGAYKSLQNSVYLIRTVDLRPGKNRFKIVVDGKQLGTTKTYSMPEMISLPAMPWEQTSLDQVLSTFVARSIPSFSSELKLVQIGEEFALTDGASLRIKDIGIYDVGSEEYELSISSQFSWEQKRKGLAWGNYSIVFDDGSETTLCEWFGDWCLVQDADYDDGWGTIFNESLPFGKTPFMLKINPSDRSKATGMPTYGILLGELEQYFETQELGQFRSGELPGVTYKVDIFEDVARIEIAGLPKRLIGKDLSVKQLRRLVFSWAEVWEYPELMFTREITSDKITILISPVEAVLRSWMFFYVEDELVMFNFTYANVVPLWIKDAVRGAARL